VHILALDISLSATGILVLNLDGNPVHGECIKTEASAKKRKIMQMEDDHERISTIVSTLNQLHKKYNFQIVVGEVPPGFSKSARSATAMGMAKSCIWTWALVLKIPFFAVTPRESKKAVCGNPNASKEDVQKAVQALWSDFKFPSINYILEAVCDAGAAYIVARNNAIFSTIIKMKKEVYEN